MPATDTESPNIAHLAAILADSEDAVISKRISDGLILYWNRAATKTYGWTAEEARGKTIGLVIPEHKMAEEIETRARIKSGERLRYTTERKRKDGTVFPVSVTLSPVADPDTDEIVGAAGFTRDLSGVSASEFDTRQRLKAIIDSSEDAVVWKDLDGTIQEWNDAAERMYQYKAEDVIGKSIDMLIPEGEKRKEERNFRDRIRRGEPVHHYDTVRLRQDKTPVAVSLTLSPVANATGDVVGAIGFARDIGQRLDDAQLLDILINSDFAIIRKAIETGEITWANNAAVKVYGYDHVDELIGLNIERLLPDDEQYRDEERRTRRLIQEGKRVSEEETVRRRRDGTLIDVSVSIAPITDANGRVVATARFTRDITEEKRLAHEREQARGMLEHFAAYLAHDFKTPLGNVRFQAQEALGLIPEDAPDELRDYVRNVVAHTRWMQNRTRGLAQVVGLNRQQTVRENVDLQEQFEEAVSMLTKVSVRAGKATIRRVGDSLPCVESNAVLMGFLFQNVLDNACKYGRRNVPVEVEVSATRQGDFWMLDVSDNGRGVRPEMRKRVLEVYVQDETPDDEDRPPGSGIGLHFCKLIADWHHGELSIHDRLGGVGTTVRFAIPA